MIYLFSFVLNENKKQNKEKMKSINFKILTTTTTIFDFFLVRVCLFGLTITISHLFLLLLVNGIIV
jgi:hypothetical protein